MVSRPHVPTVVSQKTPGRFLRHFPGKFAVLGAAVANWCRGQEKNICSCLRADAYTSSFPENIVSL